MGLSCLRHPRIPTNLRCLPLVLGLPINSPDRQRHRLGQARYLRTSTDRHHYTNRHLALGHRNSLTLRPSGLLPSSAGPNS